MTTTDSHKYWAAHYGGAAYFTFGLLILIANALGLDGNGWYIFGGVVTVLGLLTAQGKYKWQA
jgi:hypothetical protein